jgi:hypothetical protein
MAGIVLVAGSAAFLSRRQAEPVLDGAGQGEVSVGGRLTNRWATALDILGILSIIPGIFSGRC